MQRETGYIGKKMMKLELPGRRRRGRPQRRSMDLVKEEMQRVGVTKEDAWIGEDECT